MTDLGPHAWRLALSVTDMELRDCALRPDAYASWRRVFSHHIGARTPQDARACMLKASLPVCHSRAAGSAHTPVHVPSR